MELQVAKDRVESQIMDLGTGEEAFSLSSLYLFLFVFVFLSFVL
jgi:hypothetical protein